MNIDEKYMHRCLQLAVLGKTFVSPNPMVGAVLVYDDAIIGEGYHQQFGQAHAEVNCINSVSPSNKHLIANSTLYVSLEPCNHFGKTPPCSHLIVQEGIKKVVIGCVDSFNKVNGQGINYLKQHNIEVIVGVLQAECEALNNYFFYSNTCKKPYIILKYAQTANEFIGNESEERLMISNKITNVFTDSWRSEVDAILVGKNTVTKDNPSLITKHFLKRQQIRMFIDNDLQVDKGKLVMNEYAKTIIFNKHQSYIIDNVFYIKYDGIHLIDAIIKTCYEQAIQSIMVEGGAVLLQYLIDNQCFNECRVITNSNLTIQKGIKSPVLRNLNLIKKQQIFNDTISYYIHAGQ